MNDLEVYHEVHGLFYRKEKEVKPEVTYITKQIILFIKSFKFSTQYNITIIIEPKFLCSPVSQLHDATI
jgi:hypothetical protein